MASKLKYTVHGFLNEVRVSEFSDGRTEVHITCNDLKEAEWWRGVIKPLPMFDVIIRND